MKYVVIDIETTGVPGKDGPIEDLQILEFGAVIEDTNDPKSWDDVPKFNKIIRHNTYSGGAFAINMNARIFEILAKRETYRGESKELYDRENGIIKLEELAKEFYDFLFPYFGKAVSKDEDEFTKVISDYNRYNQAPFTITPAGKNFDSFDRKFIDLIPKWSNYIRLRHRTIDPTTPYIDWFNDEQPPGLGDCLQRAGIMKKVTHKAVEDCWDTLEVLRGEYNIEKPWMKKELQK